MKIGKLAVVAGLLLLMLGTSPVLADSPHSSLSLNLNGALLSAGTEHYSHQGGQVVAGEVLGVPLDPSHSVIHYSLSAVVSGLTVSGQVSFDLKVNGHQDSTVEVKGTALIGDMVPAEEFPLGCTLGVDCTSAIPGAFLGLANVTIANCNGESDNCPTTQMMLPMQFESAFLNPFGGPIVMASAGGELMVIATYSQSRVIWTGTQLGGIASGSLAGNPVSGEFAMTVSATEDLRGGYELDHGTIAFFGFDNPALNAAGTFVGKSTIPAGVPCDPSLGFPPGTCQITGFSSSGVFAQTNALGGSIKGTYSTQWTAPAVLFSSTVSATVK
ncbi:MAG TPA: hypothetical protein VFE91_05530 [Nitrososphaerales archaeon]|nr:hypothetical protein [Nitrososphaerales archaeon]